MDSTEGRYRLTHIVHGQPPVPSGRFMTLQAAQTGAGTRPSDWIDEENKGTVFRHVAADEATCQMTVDWEITVDPDSVG